jgi:hypothetical protein
VCRSIAARAIGTPERTRRASWRSAETARRSFADELSSVVPKQVQA